MFFNERYFVGKHFTFLDNFGHIYVHRIPKVTSTLRRQISPFECPHLTVGQTDINMLKINN